MSVDVEFDVRTRTYEVVARLSITDELVRDAPELRYLFEEFARYPGGASLHFLQRLLDAMQGVGALVDTRVDGRILVRSGGQYTPVGRVENFTIHADTGKAPDTEPAPDDGPRRRRTRIRREDT